MGGVCFGCGASLALAFECTKELFHLLHSAFDASGFADFSGATQSARLLR